MIFFDGVMAENFAQKSKIPSFHAFSSVLRSFNALVELIHLFNGSEKSSRLHDLLVRVLAFCFWIIFAYYWKH